jgi:hypothetical protein
VAHIDEASAHAAHEFIAAREAKEVKQQRGRVALRDSRHHLLEASEAFVSSDSWLLQSSSETCATGGRITRNNEKQRGKMQKQLL